jgi:hypothetical protein
MRQPELERQRALLRSLIRRVGHAADLHDIEMQAHWAKYLCILVAGFVENSLRLTFGRYVKQSSQPRVARYFESRLNRLQNPKAKNVVELVASFDPLWAKNLETFLSGNNRKDAIDSILNNRHLIAHGQNSGITVASVDQYLNRIVEVVEFLEQELGV